MKTILIIILASYILIVAFLLTTRSCVREQVKQELNVYYSDSIIRIKNEHNQELAKQEVLIVESEKELHRVLGESRYKDEIIERLVKKSKGASEVIGVNTLTKFDTIVKTRVVYRDSLPHYIDEVKNDWIELSVDAWPDSSDIKLSVVNKLDIVKKEEKRKYIAEITQLNPYSTTTDAQTIEFEKKRPYKGIKAAVLVLTFVAGILIGK